MKRDDKRTLIVVLIVCLLCVTMAVIFSRKSNFDKLSVVDDYSTFFSVTEEVNNYIKKVSSKDKNAILNFLSDDYVNTKKITYDNVLDYVDLYSSDATLKSSSISSVSIGKNKLYYVSGRIVENRFDEVKIINDDFKIIVLNDVINNCYSIYPVDSSNLEKDINNIKKISINNNSDNSIAKKINYTDVQICNLYFSDFINMILSNADEAYQLLDNSMHRYFSNLKEFKNYINENITRISSLSKLCSKDELKDGRIYTVIDNKDNIYYFTENGVMNYKVKFYLKNDEENEQ